MSEILISLNQIEAEKVFIGWQKLLESKNKTKADDELFPFSDVLENNGLSDTLWCLKCLPEYDLLWRKFAWWCATQMVDNATDKRVQECLDVVWRFTEGEATEEELEAARSAAQSAAQSASWSVVESASGLVAESASWLVAESATWSAAESVAVGSVAWSATRSARSAAIVTPWTAESVAQLAQSAQSAKLKQLLDAGEWVSD